ncbi:DUF3093 domain-containing protein [Gulosibacter faecalis]|jgi:hypothetical protein|uniref:DUF3093 domain-containing protein n=1 Tax=Gulosibacter faecalis TaxID=272240 RepID=A0ABW5V2W7_9MICO|nr:DUF3093 domain-containing protein [Gulosibacter faecalis]
MYRERVSPSIWMYVVGALLVPAMIVVFLPINIFVGIILGLALFGGYLAILVSGSPTIEITDTTLRVGGARIPLRYVGRATANTTPDAARQAAGPGLDARAWTTLRGWVRTSVRVDITDDRDPIPYWLFSTRHPRELVERLDAAVAQLPKRS